MAGTHAAKTLLHPVVMAVPEPDRSLKGRDMVRALRRHARSALEHACRISGLTIEKLEKDDRGAPLPSGGVFWSLAHKTEMVAAVAAARPVGIDIEPLRPVSPPLMQRIADEAEWALSESADDALFFRYWTAKEAVLKAVGRGLTGLERCRIRKLVDDTHLELTYDGRLWRVVQVWTGDDHIAAVTAPTDHVEWHLLT